MATDVLSIWNMALSTLGNSVEVQDENENSANANACRRFYEQVRDHVLEAFPWPFAKVIAALALVEADPTPEYYYAYRMPSDCVTPLRIVSATLNLRNPGPAQIIPYKIGRDSDGSLIYCDLENASLEYVQRVEDPTEFGPAFTDAVTFRLAWAIAPRVTGGDPYKLGDRAYQLSRQAIAEAAANALNDEQPDQLPDAEWISDRE